MPMWFEDFSVGSQVTTAARAVTEADIVAFADLSGDNNPIHVDAAFAAKTPFGQRIAHGLLGLSIATGLSAATGHLDGTAIAFVGLDEWRFLAPVRIGDSIHLRWTVLEARPSSRPDAGVLVRRMEIVNQEGTVVQSGKFTVLVRRRPPAKGDGR